MVLNFPLAPLARLGRARAYARSGDAVRARAAYLDLLQLWHDADPGSPILKQASEKYTKLTLIHLRRITRSCRRRLTFLLRRSNLAMTRVASFLTMLKSSQNLGQFLLRPQLIFLKSEASRSARARAMNSCHVGHRQTIEGSA